MALDEFEEVRKNLLADLTVHSNAEDKAADECSQLRVYMRLRPLTDQEQKTCGSDEGHQPCINIQQDGERVLLNAPPGSHLYKRAIQHHGSPPPGSTFTFTHAFGPDTTQAHFYSEGVSHYVNRFISGDNCLLFAHGVTNSGKTHTIQGSPTNAGMIPRALAQIFGTLGGHSSEGANRLKPVMAHDVRKLSDEEMAQCALEKDVLLSKANKTRLSSSESIYPTTFTLDNEKHGVEGHLHGDARLAVWVSFIHIYKEQIYDLLTPRTPDMKGKSMGLREDGNGLPYVQGVKYINIRSTEEAIKVMKYGQQNLQFASTNLNNASSRSHAIFSIKLVKVSGGKEELSRINMLSFCDLAGSERTARTHSVGERLKEAGNINGSLMTLGKCIAALRHNQRVNSSDITSKTQAKVVPFRESKLTRLFQTFLCGRGHVCMIVSASPCDKDFDETFEVFKFAALAQQVTFDHVPEWDEDSKVLTNATHNTSVNGKRKPANTRLRSIEGRLSKVRVGRIGRSSSKYSKGSQGTSKDRRELHSFVSSHHHQISKAEEDIPECDPTCVDLPMPGCDEATAKRLALEKEIESLRSALEAERSDRENLEVNLRAEIFKETTQIMRDMESHHMEDMDNARFNAEELMEAQLTIYSKAINGQGTKPSVR